MTTFELLQRQQQHLGEQTAFYTDSELLVNGLNPALRLLCLARPTLLRQRQAITITADLPFYDLRQLGSRIVRLHRVVVGTITGDDLTADATTGRIGDLTPISVLKLAASQAAWLKQQGPAEHYWEWRDWLGIFPRPATAMTVTIIYDALPTALTLETPDTVPDLAAVYHPLIAEMAAGLVRVKEAGVEGQRGLATVARLLGLQAPGTPATAAPPRAQ